MTQKNAPPNSWLGKAAQAAGKGLTAAGLLFGAGALTAGCLDRPVTPATPQTTNVYISQIRQTGVDKIDLLFMIDNSISMADKQQILSQAVPVLVQRLIQPTCLDMNGMPIAGQFADPKTGHCNQGIAEFNPIKDIHIGIVTSSLGDHGSNDVCSDAQNQSNIANGSMPSFYNDLAQLLPSVRPMSNIYNWNNSGFLVWDPRDQTMVSDPHTPISMNETDPATFQKNFTTMVTATGEHGCGYEASLEAWYRFLVDPSPVSSMSNDGQNSVRPKAADGKSDMVNNLVLQQRTAFLRPDSLLAIVVLTDENDCSIMDENGTQGWLTGYKGGVGKLNWDMPRANSVCATNPNDACCRPCTSPAPKGCADNSTDMTCAMGNYLTLDEDSMNQRCYNMKKRFGVDLLYPTGRYVEALKSTLITPRLDGVQVPNPIFAAPKGQPPRDPGLVFFAAITGVPWQDISTTDSWQGRGLTYMTAQQLMDNGRWSVLLGDPTSGTPPTDPFMIEQIDPRMSGAQNPLIPSITIQPSNTTTPNQINGHEQDVLPVRDDLQFACIFDLSNPYTPAQCAADSDGCDCNADEFDKHSPLCMGTTAMADGTQNKAKAYPGVRQLQVLKDFGLNSIVASICPKNITAMGDMAADPNYGYNPAVGAIVNRLKEALTVKCLPRPLAPATEGADVGKVPCAVVEVTPMLQDASGNYTQCADPTCMTMGRFQLTGDSAKVEPAARQYLEQNGICGGKNEIPCANECFCGLDQFTNSPTDPTQDQLTICQTVASDPGTQYGYCYVDPSAATTAATDPNSDQGKTITAAEQSVIDGETALVKDCQSTQKRILRFMGDGVPAKNGLAFIACIGATPSE
jgi:hypothetical protein